MGLDMSWGKDETTYGYDLLSYEALADYESDWSSLTFLIFGEGGIDYYVADKYAITGSLTAGYRGWAWDSNTDSDDNPIYGSSTWFMRVGLGVATYF